MIVCIKKTYIKVLPLKHVNSVFGSLEQYVVEKYK